VLIYISFDRYALMEKEGSPLIILNI